MMESERQAMTRLFERGFTERFQGVTDGLRGSDGRVRSAEAMFVEETVRFEGASNPDDSAVLFALTTRDGRRRGTYLVAFGPGMDPLDVELVSRLHPRAASRPSRGRGGELDIESNAS